MDQKRKLREQDFHDAWAEQTGLSQVRVHAAFENLTAPENRYILKLMGDLTGLRLLDIGAGLGESSVYFALKGARVTANDLSPVMLERIVALGRHYGVEVTPLLGSAEHDAFGAEAFDVVYGANVLHHVQDLGAVLRGVSKALRPGGRFFFIDPLAYNPAIQVYRRLASKVRTEDETPLTFAVLDLFKEIFSEVQHREFWLASLLIFFKYYFIDGIDPNRDRYWKRILREDPDAIGWWFKPLLRLDELLLKLPWFHYLAWNIVIWGRK